MPESPLTFSQTALGWLLVSITTVFALLYDTALARGLSNIKFFSLGGLFHAIFEAVHNAFPFIISFFILIVVAKKINNWRILIPIYILLVLAFMFLPKLLGITLPSS